MIVGLVGNQNAGKTTLFNLLTGSNQKVGNWPGVTIERKEGLIKGSNDITLVDTPGVYSLSPYTDEEKVTRKFCLTARPDLIINIIDATSLERSLYLTTQLLELNTDVIVACNMSDILAENGITLDAKKLQTMLGTTVIVISAKKGTGISELIDAVRHKAYLKNPHTKIFEEPVQKEIDHLEGDLNHELEESHNPKFAAVKLFERDPYFQALTNTSTEQEIRTIEQQYGMDAEQIIADQRYDFVTKIKSACETDKDMGESMTDKLDKVFLNKWAALPIFVVIMALVYFLSVGLVGSLTTDFMDALFNGSTSINVFYHEVSFNIKGLGPLLGDWILSLGGSPWAADLIQNGIVAGVGAVCNFIPQLIILFLCLSILETTGYMSRISFFLDRVFKRFGLSGKSLIPFIVGSGCSVPAIMSARTVEDPKERKMTIMLTPFIPCSAKLPIIALLSSVVFPSYGWVASLSLYLLAVALILINALILRPFLKSNTSSFISELPAYKAPSPKYVFRDVYDKTIAFIKRAGTVILLCSVVVWTLSRFTWTWQYVYTLSNQNLTDGALQSWQIGQSMLGGIGRVIAFVFIPTLGGNYSWGAAVSALQGLIAKEQVVSSLSVIAGGGKILASESFAFFVSNPWAAYGFMVFNLFSAPCFGAISAMRKELGSTKATLQTIVFETTVALLLSSVIGTIGWASNGWVVHGL
jgi:ferrous iron transport protein B